MFTSPKLGPKVIELMTGARLACGGGVGELGVVGVLDELFPPHAVRIRVRTSPSGMYRFMSTSTDEMIDSLRSKPQRRVINIDDVISSWQKSKLLEGSCRISSIAHGR